VWSSLCHDRVLAGREDRDALLLGHGGDGVENFTAVFSARASRRARRESGSAREGRGGEQGGEDEADGEQFFLGRVGDVVVGNQCAAEVSAPSRDDTGSPVLICRGWGMTSLSSLAPSPPALRLSLSSASLMAVRALVPAGLWPAGSGGVRPQICMSWMK
jgi:hypothetical protein